VGVRPFVAVAALTVAATLAIAGGWIWFDMKSLAAPEHYAWDGWGLVFLPGAYTAAVVCVFGRVLHGGCRLVRRGRGSLVAG
jgi:hypothetical protein